MLYRSKLLVFIIVSTITFTGCAITTLYGKKPSPIQGEKDAYRYTIYYNIATSNKDIEKRAHQVAEELVTERGCKGYTLEAIPNKTFGAQDIDFIAYLDC
jgi:hypothetical protein